MKRTLFTLSILLAALDQPVLALPTPDTVHALLAQDPALNAAMAQQQASAYAASPQSGSPYEWTASVSAQQRRTDDGPSSQEWNAALERGVRWPGKAGLDQQLATLTRQEADGRVAVVRTETAQELLTLWLDWAQAKSRINLLTQQQDLSVANLVSVRQRIRSGDAAVQEETLALSEQSSLASQQALAQLQSQQAELALRSRFPTLALNDATLPPPLMPGGEAQEWQTRILAVNPQLALSRLQTRLAQLRAERVRADTKPDPTLGIFTASEARNTERIIGLSLSLPLSGSRRQQQAAQAQAEANAVELGNKLEAQRRESAIAQAWPTAKASVEVWQLAKTSADQQTLAADRGQKGFKLGETTFTELLLLRRQAISSAEAELSARVNAWRALYSLDIAAQRGWLATDFEREAGSVPPH